MTEVTDDKVLVAEIGGTNSRFALVDVKENMNLQQDIVLEHLEIRSTASFNSIQEAVTSYAEKIPNCRPKTAVMVVAAPVVDDYVRFSKFPWEFSTFSFADSLRLDNVRFLNDFAAIASAIPFLKAGDLRKIGQGQEDSKGPKVVLGPGTGMGVATIVPIGDRWKVIPGEGGQISFAPLTDIEFEVLKVLQSRHPRVHNECILSGQGLVELYTAIGAVEKVDLPNLSPAGITEEGQKGTNKQAEMALKMFCEILGSFAGDMALTVNATGGIYLAGGILTKIEDFFDHVKFRERFEDKGCVQYIKNIPTYQITEEQPALVGAALWAAQEFYNKKIFI